MKKLQNKKLINRLFTPQIKISSSKLQEKIRLSKQLYKSSIFDSTKDPSQQGLIYRVQSLNQIHTQNIGNINLLKKTRQQKYGKKENEFQNVWDLWKNNQNYIGKQHKNLDFIQKLQKQINKEALYINELKKIHKIDKSKANKFNKYQKTQNKSQFVINHPKYDHMAEYLYLKTKQENQKNTSNICIYKDKNNKENSQKILVCGRKIQNLLLAGRINTSESDQLRKKKNQSRFLSPKYNKSQFKNIPLVKIVKSVEDEANNKYIKAVSQI